MKIQKASWERRFDFLWEELINRDFLLRDWENAGEDVKYFIRQEKTKSYKKGYNKAWKDLEKLDDPVSFSKGKYAIGKLNTSGRQTVKVK